VLSLDEVQVGLGAFGEIFCGFRLALESAAAGQVPLTHLPVSATKGNSFFSVSFVQIAGCK
jgi:hypothetical protein